MYITRNRFSKKSTALYNLKCLMCRNGEYPILEERDFMKEELKK